VLGSRYWRRGIGSAAVRAMLDELASVYGVKVFAATVKKRNLRSLALLERLGFATGVPIGARALEHELDEVTLYRPADVGVAAEEWFEILDEDGLEVGVAPRSRVHREGLWHRAANVLLFRSDGRLIVQRRQLSKDVCPGLWDLSVAEHLQPGETYEKAALRGLREELGVARVALEPLGGVHRACLELPLSGLKDYELQQSFRGVFDGALEPNRDEVGELGLLTLDELGAAFAARPGDFTPWFRDTAVRLGCVEWGGV